MTFTKAALPSAVEVGGRLYPIHTDFRYALLFLQRVKEDAPLMEMDFMYAGKPPSDRAAGVNAIAEWINPKRELPRPSRIENSDVLLDYEQDAPLIFAAFWEMYGIDLFDEKTRLHWHKFLALLSGLHGTRLNEVQSYRAYKPHRRVCGHFFWTACTMRQTLPFVYAPSGTYCPMSSLFARCKTIQGTRQLPS